jgi:hypothetical protein
MSEFVILTSPRAAGLRVRMRMDEAGLLLVLLLLSQRLQRKLLTLSNLEARGVEPLS